MSIRTFFIIAAFAALSFGVGFVLVPEFVGSIFGINFDADGAMIARFFGALLITVGVWFFMMRGTEDAAAARAMLTGYLIGLVIGVFNALTSTLAGTMNSFGWLIVLMYGGLAVGAVYCLFVQPSYNARSAFGGQTNPTVQK
jgi:hypothetical protein